MSASLYSTFRATADRQPGATAVIEPEGVLTYRALTVAIEDLAGRIHSRGAERGSRVALLFPNGSGFVTAFFAIARVGGVSVPLNPLLKAPEMGAILRDAGATVVVTSAELRALAEESIGQMASASAPEIEVLSGRSDAAGSEAAPPHEPAGSDSALFLYSSGSTGAPKRIERTHANLLFDILGLVGEIDMTPSDRVLGAAPFSHVNGMTRSMIASMLSGATLIPLRQFERRAAGRVIEEHGVTIFIAVPFMFATLAETRWPAPVDLSSLRLCISSSAPLRPEDSQKFRDRFGLFVRQLYGSSETGTISVNLDDDVSDTLESVGRPIPGVQVEIFSEEGKVLGPDEFGEIGIRSPGATTQYPGLPEQTKIAFRHGFFFPGDMGRKDADGRVYLMGRRSLFINRGGFKVNPYEVEDAISTHPNVAEVAVVGIEGDYGDEKIKAVVVAREGLEARDVIEHCRARLADFKVPSVVEFRDELPKSATGKLLRRSL
jgi:long-chain acyl-CoA synthetase